MALLYANNAHIAVVKHLSSLSVLLYKLSCMATICALVSVVHLLCEQLLFIGVCWRHVAVLKQLTEVKREWSMNSIYVFYFNRRHFSDPFLPLYEYRFQNYIPLFWGFIKQRYWKKYKANMQICRIFRCNSTLPNL